VELELWHHVYSSQQGYRTLFASPELPPDIAARAEEMARKLYRIVGRRPQHGLYRAAPGLLAALRGFHFGTDHAGRARTCVHTILLREDQLAWIPGFTSFEVPDDLFLPEDTDLQYLGGELRKSWSLPQAADAPHPSIDLPEEWIRLLFPCLLDSVAATVVVDPGGSATGMIAALAHALPPATRRALTFLDGAFIEPSQPPPFGVTICTAIPPEATLGSDVAVIDLATNQSRNLPPPSAFSDFVVSSLAPGGTPADLWTFIAALERYESDRWFTIPELGALLAVFRAARLFKPDGTFITGNAATAVNAVMRLFRAGAVRIAFSLLDDTLASHVPQAAGLLREQLRAAIQNPAEPALADMVRKARSLLGVKTVKDDDTNVSLPDVPVDRIEDHMIEEDSDDDLLLDSDKIS
jgi:hypothetical protein